MSVMDAYRHRLEEQVRRTRNSAIDDPTSEKIAAYGQAITDRWIGTSVLRRGTAYGRVADLHRPSGATRLKGIWWSPGTAPVLDWSAAEAE
jgi:hypothetical protein